MEELKKLRDKSKKIFDEYPGEKPEKIKNEYKKINQELNNNASKLRLGFRNYLKDNNINLDMDKRFSIIKDIDNWKYLSYDEIPELKGKKETTKKPSSTLAKLKEEVNELIPTLTSAQKKLIVKIPHDTYTAKNIYQIIKYIHSGEIKKESDFPKAGKGDKVNLEDLIPIKKKNKNLKSDLKTESKSSKLKEEVDELIPQLTKEQKKLIVKIPNDTYTAKNIYQIIKMIHSGQIKTINDFPKPGKGKITNIEELYPIKRKPKTPQIEEPTPKKRGRPKKIIVEESKTEIIQKPKGKAGRPKKIVVEEVKVEEKKPRGRPRKTPKEEVIEVKGNNDLPKNIFELAEMNSEIYLKTKNFKDAEYVKIKKIIDALEEEYKAYVDKYKDKMDDDTYNDVIDLIDADDEQVGTLDDIDKYINEHNSKDYFFPIEERKKPKSKVVDVKDRKKGYNKDGSKRKTRTAKTTETKYNSKLATLTGKINSLKSEFNKIDYYIRNYKELDKEKVNNKSINQLKTDKEILKNKMLKLIEEIEEINKDKKEVLTQKAKLEAIKAKKKKRSSGKGIYTHMSDDDYSSDDFEI